jgi:hypothetical protein
MNVAKSLKRGIPKACASLYGLFESKKRIHTRLLVRVRICTRGTLLCGLICLP